MKFEIKNVKFFAAMTDETHCFEATVYVDGKRSFIASNRGNGGDNDYSPLKGCKHNETWHQIADINAELAKEKITCKFGDGDDKEFVYNNDLDNVICDLVNNFLQEKEAKKILKKIAYMKGDDLYTVNYKPTPENITKVKNCSWWDESNVLLNTMPIEQARTYIK